MLNKLFLKIFGVFDIVKDWLLHWGLRILLIFFVLIILHNVLKMSELSIRYTGDYKKMVPVYEEENKFMNSYVLGDGSKTIVILSAFGSQSPIIQYKTLLDELKNDYRVVIVEYFGYGYSMSIKKPRTNENIASEIKTMLELREIYGPYVLVAHETSNMYAMKFQEMYPDLVQGIVSIDGLYPSEIDDEYRAKQISNEVSNVNITSIFELTGFERITSYLSPKTFYIDKMKEMPDVYTKEDIAVYRNRIGSQYLSRTMVREINKLEDNMNEMKQYKYPNYLPVLELLSSESIKIYSYDKQSGSSEVDLYDLANNVITNPGIQQIKEIEGDYMLQLTNPKATINAIKNFLVSF